MADETARAETGRAETAAVGFEAIARPAVPLLHRAPAATRAHLASLFGIPEGGASAVSTVGRGAGIPEEGGCEAPEGSPRGAWLDRLALPAAGAREYPRGALLSLVPPPALLLANRGAAGWKWRRTTILLY